MEYYASFTNFENMAFASQSKVCFFFDNVSFSLSNRNKLKKFIEKMFKKENRKLLSLNYVFCSDKSLLAINKEHLGHDFYTDIITFDLSEGEQGITAEIYISIDRVRENASLLRVSFRHELLRVMFHGVLHLCGYKDKTKNQVSQMRSLEEYYISSYESANKKS